MSLKSFLFGKKEKMQQVPTMSGQQTDLLNMLLGNLGGPMSSGLGNLASLLGGDTEAFEAPLMRQFQEQTVPSLAERFSSLGSGAQGSSAFGQQLGAAGAGLMENLGALRGNLQMQGLGQLQGLLGTGLGQRTFENAFRPGTTGFLGGIAGGIGQGLGSAGGMAAGTKLMKLLGLTGV